MQRKEGFIHVRLDADLREHVEVIKERPGGMSRFVNDAIRNDRDKLSKKK